MHFLFNKLNNREKLKPDKNAIVYNEERISYEVLNKKVISFSAQLKNKGVKKGDKVALISNNNPDLIISILALWFIKAIPVPLNIRLTENELKEQIEYSDSVLVILDSSLKKKITSPENKIITTPFKHSGKKLKIESEKTDLNSPALIMFTSGSTGKPKAIVLSFNNLISSAENGNLILQQNENDRWLASLPFYHIGGFSIFVRAILFGASVLIPSSLETDDLIKSIQKNKPTLVSLVSTQLKRLIEKDISPNKELRYVLLGGGFIEDDLIKEAINKNWKLIKGYGSTETSSFVTALNINDEDEHKKITSAGKPVLNNDVLIVDKNRNILSPGNEGEILVKSKSVFVEYYKNPELTKKKKLNSCYFTGDIGYLDKDFYLYVLSRRTDLIITGGENVNPVEVENEIKRFEGIEEVCVLGINDKYWGQIVAAVYSSKKIIEEEELKKYLKQKLAGYKIPKKIIRVNEIPKNEMGKVNRKVLLEKIKNL